jgi:PAS domain S-box-containing protein
MGRNGTNPNSSRNSPARGVNAMSQKNPASGLLALKKIVEETSLYTGKEFFRALVKNLAETLEITGVWITEYDKKEERLRAQAFWLRDCFVDRYEYAVAGTPCEAALHASDIFHVPERVIALFPKDPDLPPLNAVSYIGLALKTEKGEVMGHLAALDDRPMPELPESFAVFRLFAVRAEAELRRLRYERRLLENESKLKRLVSGALNGIIEMDDELRITQANPAAVQLFGARIRAGQPVRDLLSPDGYRKLLDTLQQLEAGEEGRPAAGIPGYVACLLQQGEMFHARASLSKFTEEGRIYYFFTITNVQDLLLAMQEVEKLRTETALLKDEIRSIQNPAGLTGKSPAMQQVCALIRQVAPTNSTVLVTGETGTGKELVARAIHHQSPRQEKTLITVNCAALPPELIESELFGHVKGAFTGAHNAREGKFVLANGSTLFLDEIGEMPLALQAKLLRVLQEGEVQPIGSGKTIRADVRIVAATNRDLAAEVRAGAFREDLYYRLNVFPIHLPPLRERGEDVLEIAEAFIEKHARILNKKAEGLDEASRRLLLHYPWPGNVRELQNIIERALIMSRNGRLDIASLLQITPSSTDSVSPEANGEQIFTAGQLRDIERDNILRALRHTRWRISGPEGAAALLGLPATTLNSKIRALGIERPGL